MSKYHVREGGCARAQTGLSVDIEDFRKMLASSKCEVCRKKTEELEMTKTIITRVCPGLYYIERGDHKVEVIQHVEFQGPDKWIARAMWDQYYLTDPVATYRDAKRHAIDMLDNPKCL